MSETILSANKSVSAAMKRHNKAMVDAAKHLDAAATALHQMHMAAIEEGLPVKGQDDTRITLQASCREYAGFLAMRIEQLVAK